jgi:hypothetical protein
MCVGKPVPITAADIVVFTGHLGDHLYGINRQSAATARRLKLASKFRRGGR